MQRRDRAIGEIPDQREMQEIGMEVKHIKFVRPPADFLQHHDLMRQMIFDGRIKTERHIRARHELRGGDRISAGKKRDVMALGDQFFGEIGNNALGSPIEFGRNTFSERCDLSDLHRQNLLY
jgi:hypothetical protein